MTRHMSGPLREKAPSLLLGLFSLRDHAPPPPSPLSLLAPPSEEAPPPPRPTPADPAHALVSWHVAGLFALASRPCKRCILTTLGEGSS